MVFSGGVSSHRSSPLETGSIEKRYSTSAATAGAARARREGFFLRKARSPSRHRAIAQLSGLSARSRIFERK
jgi:hypothetical protein